MELLNKIHSVCEQNIKNRGCVISVGLATFDPGQDRAFARVFRRADQQMYERKLELKKTQKEKPLSPK